MVTLNTASLMQNINMPEMPRGHSIAYSLKDNGTLLLVLSRKSVMGHHVLSQISIPHNNLNDALIQASVNELSRKQ